MTRTFHHRVFSLLIIVVSPKLIAKMWRRSVALFLASSALFAVAREAPDHSSLTNYDRRLAPAKAAAQPGQRIAQAKLQAQVPDAAIDFDPVLGTPQWVHARGGFLTGADGALAVSCRSAARMNDFFVDPATVSRWLGFRVVLAPIQP